MEKIPCPYCGGRLFDSDKSPYVSRLSKSNEAKADMILKHHVCGNLVSVRFRKNTKPEYHIPEGTERQ